MGMKEEIFSIATALGYDGPTPTSKTKAVHAVAEAVESGGTSGGGAAGYDVTKVWAVPEQTVTSRWDEDESAWLATVTVGDLAQMLADGQTALTLVVDGTEDAVRLTQMMGPSGEQIIIIPDPDAVADNYAVFPMGETAYAISSFEDTEPTTHTVSCHYENVTTTPDFVSAVNKAANPSKIGALEFMGYVQLHTPEDGSVTIGAGEGAALSMDNCVFEDADIVEKYGENWSYRLKTRTLVSVTLPMGLQLGSFNANTMTFGVYNPTDTAYVFSNLNQGAVLEAACFC